METEPLSVINFRHHAYSSTELLVQIFFAVRITENAELTGKKAKRLVSELETELKNFQYNYDDIKIVLSDLDDFFCYQASDRRIEGGWHSVHFHSCFLSADEDTRRKDFERILSVLSKELKSWKFSHYAMTLEVLSVESK